MALEHADVLRAAHLARLGLSDEEAAHYQDDLGRILEMVDQLQALDTEGVAPLAHPLDTTQRLRADEVTESDQRSEEHTSELQSRPHLVCRLLLEKKKKDN